MSFLRRVLFSRFGRLGLLSDVAMVGAAALRVLRRPNDQSRGQAAGGMGEMVLVAGAALRLLRRIRRVRKNRRAGLAAADYDATGS